MQGKLRVEDRIDTYLPGVPEDKRAITLHHLLTHTAGLESDFAGVHPDIAPLHGEKEILKHRYSAFYNTDLETILRVLRVEDLVITGVMTNMCCETTARDAYQRDYRVFFPADASGSTTEDFHPGQPAEPLLWLCTDHHHGIHPGTNNRFDSGAGEQLKIKFDPVNPRLQDRPVLS